MPALHPEILVIGLDPAGIEVALGAAFARLPVVLVTQGERRRSPGGLDSLNRLAALGGRIIEAEGRFRDSRHFFVGDHTISARRTVLALPAQQNHSALYRPALFGLDAPPRWAPGQPATAVLVLGGGPQAPALAAAARSEGHRAILVSPGPLLAGFDAEAVGVIAQRLTRDGVEQHIGFPLEGARIEACPEGYLLHPAGGAPIGFSHLCMADAAPPALEGLALGEAGVLVEKGYPRLQRDALATTNSRILAVGATRSPLADVANARAEARIVLANILFRQSAGVALAQVPRLAHGPLALLEAGLSEAALGNHQREGLRYYRVPLAAGGVLKAVTDRKGRVRRLCVLAPHAARFAAPLLQWMADARPLAELARLPLPHLEEADALAALGTQAMAEQLSGFGARLTMRLLRALG